MKFYVFRHGQTDWNKETRIQGHSNIPLNSQGREQAKELSKILEKLDLEIIYSSDLDRAYETAQIACEKLDIEIIKDKNLREAHFGDAEGLLLDQIIEKFGSDLWEKFMKVDIDHLDICFPHGETRRDSIIRMRGVIDRIITEGKFSRVGISTHGGVVRNLLGSYILEKGKTKTVDIPIPNCVVYELEFRDSDFYVSGPVT